MTPGIILKVPRRVRYIRTISEFILRPLFPRILIDESKALNNVRYAALDGKGLVIIFTHFSLRDAMEVNRSIIFNDPILKSREVINPLAFHQYNLPMRLMGKIYHGTFFPIVNNSTLMKKKYKHLQKGKGLREFIAASSETLNQGGIVTLAVNAMRSERLDIEDKQKPIGYFIASLQAMKVKEYGFLLVSFAIKNAKSYAKKEAGGMNFGKTYVINIVKYFTLRDLLNQPEVDSRLSSVDAFVRSRFAKVVPKEYL